MKLSFFSLIIRCSLFLMAFSSLNATQTEDTHKIFWNNDYEAALKESKSLGKPILVLFTGTGWCKYCTKLERNIFNNSKFAAIAGKEYIFVKLEFNEKGEALNSQFKKQHTDLVNRHMVRGYPTVVVLNSREEVLMTTGYLAVGAEQYAAHLQGSYAKSDPM